MTPERMEIARRLVACKGWVWLRGMSVRSGDHPCERWMFDGEAWVSDEGDTYRLPDECAPVSLILGVTGGPDLDEDLTRLGVLAVVRRAWGDAYARLWPALYSGWLVYCSGGQFSGPTEETALLAALEAAPQ